MLNIYYGPESLNKESFIYSHVAADSILLVPDQFTLEAEREALYYLGAEGILDFEVLSFSRLADRVLEEAGGIALPMVNRQGRHMLLEKVLLEQDENLTVFSGNKSGRTAFVEMINDLISEMKRFNVSPEVLKEHIETMEKKDDSTGGRLLLGKLRDIYLIFTAYEQEIKGRFVDTEDRLSMVASGMKDAGSLKGRSIWVSGFDTFTPKNREVLLALSGVADQVNIVMTCAGGRADQELFDLVTDGINKLKEEALAHDLEVSASEIPGPFRSEEKGPAPEIAFLEKELFHIPPARYEGAVEDGSICLATHGNPYAEAEAAAVYVSELVRNKGFRYRDIAVICNDMEGRGKIIRRVFESYGINLFMDVKRGIMASPAVTFLLAALSISETNYSSTRIFDFLKTGLTGIGTDEIEELENYVIKYRINHTVWLRPFTRGAHEYSQEALAAIEKTRSCVVETLSGFIGRYKASETVAEMVKAVYDFLAEDCRLPEQLTLLAERQETAGHVDAALETMQIWKAIMDILDQLMEIIPSEKLSAATFREILTAGLSAVEIGVLPPTCDSITFGTMQRTRLSTVKALVVLGADEATLPMQVQGGGILNDDEIERLEKEEINLCKADNSRVGEEKLAIYRNFSLPEKHLRVSYAVTGTDGTAVRPSPIFLRLKEIFSGIEIETEVGGCGNDGERVLRLINTGSSTLSHLSDAIRCYGGEQEGELEEGWRDTLRWYAANDSDRYRILKEGFAFKTEQEALGIERASSVYEKKGGYRFSPSRLETYARCPFNHFITYGLKPQERRVYEIAAREVGDVYHQALMEFSRELSSDGLPVNDPGSRWNSVSKEECRQIIRKSIAGQRETYMDGLLGYTEEEDYRTERIIDACAYVAWILVTHARRGSIESMLLEQRFGEGAQVPPMELTVCGRKIVISGIIDRVDILPENAVKIIDYKTGYETFKRSEAKSGWKLQLMVYLAAAQGIGKEEKLSPAGIFYFHIGEGKLSWTGDKLKEKSPEEQMANKFKLDGAIIDSGANVENILGEYGDAEISKIRRKTPSDKPLENFKDKYDSRAAERIFDEAEFQEFQQEVEKCISSICEGIVSGNIAVKPKKKKGASGRKACDNCGYRAICKFDIAFPDCSFDTMD